MVLYIVIRIFFAVRATAFNHQPGYYPAAGGALLGAASYFEGRFFQAKPTTKRPTSWSISWHTWRPPPKHITVCRSGAHCAAARRLSNAAWTALRETRRKKRFRTGTDNHHSRLVSAQCFYEVSFIPQPFFRP